MARPPKIPFHFLAFISLHCLVFLSPLLLTPKYTYYPSDAPSSLFYNYVSVLYVILPPQFTEPGVPGTAPGTKMTNNPLAGGFHLPHWKTFERCRTKSSKY